jgi:hypothetical protein
MAGKILLSTAYLPPVEYFATIAGTDEVLIEKEENYLKQTYRNRCCILSANGRQILTVPVYQGSYHKTCIKDIRIDYSKRWQQVHLGAFTSSYNASPWFLHYFEVIEKIILKNHKYLLDLNTGLLTAVLNFLKLNINISYTTVFKPIGDDKNDFRYRISPKIKSNYQAKKYLQVFGQKAGFVPGLSIADLVFNMGPDAASQL